MLILCVCRPMWSYCTQTAKKKLMCSLDALGLAWRRQAPSTPNMEVAPFAKEGNLIILSLKIHCCAASTAPASRLDRLGQVYFVHTDFYACLKVC